jgi:hypothetical protein
MSHYVDGFVIPLPADKLDEYTRIIRMKLEFQKPFAATNVTEFTFKPDGAGTAVSWMMSGKNNFVGKCMSLVMNCEKMIGGQFEQGFATLRTILAQPPKS